MAFLKIDNLSKEYKKNGGSIKVLNEVSCEFTENKVHVILGPSGCGKTTLLNIIAGIVQPTSGKVWLEGGVGVVFQDLRLFPWLKTKDNVAFGLKLKQLDNINQKADKYLEAVGLSGFGDHYPMELSGGMQQRLAIARSLILEPKVLLLDEPFGSLDPKTRKQMQELILNLQKSFKTTIIFVTHDTEEAISLGDSIYVLSGTSGKIKKVYAKEEDGAERDPIRLKTTLLEL